MELIAVAGQDGEHDWLTVHNAAVGARNWSAVGLRDLLRHSGAHRHTLARDGGEPVGAALGVLAEDHVKIWISVLPGRRMHGIGSMLWCDITAWASAVCVGPVETRVEADDAVSLSFARSRGFAIVREESRLVHDLSVPPPNHEEAALRVVPLREEPALIDGVYGVFAHVKALARTITRDGWEEQMLAAEAAEKQRTTVAVRDGTVAGYAILLLLAARPDVASHNGTFVHPRFKRLGVASALKAEQIAWARSVGLRRLEASADPGNEAKMRLYARFGYRELPGWCVLRMFT